MFIRPLILRTLGKYCDPSAARTGPGIKVRILIPESHFLACTDIKFLYWMAYAILSIVDERMSWYRKAVDSSMYASTAPIIKAIWDARTITAGALLGLLTIFIIRYIRSPWRKLPPGPRGLPILGNALQLMDKEWLFSRDCKERFGESVIITQGRPELADDSETRRRNHVS
jgi:hypothetical protein